MMGFCRYKANTLFKGIEMSKEKLQDFTTDFARELSDLQDGISKVRGDFQAVLDAITGAEKVKEGAKQDYAVCLDEGNEERMHEALGVVREANRELEGLRGQLATFPCKIVDLRDRQAKIQASAWAAQAAAEKLVQTGRENLKVAELQVHHGGGLLGMINSLADLISKV
jgi:hypothetical protein